jgi:hypothetical protein
VITFYWLLNDGGKNNESRAEAAGCAIKEALLWRTADDFLVQATTKISLIKY